MVGQIDDPLLAVPQSQINMKFKKLKLNVERQSFRQLLKIKSFLGVGSFKSHINGLTEVLSNLGPPADELDQELLESIKLKSDTQLVVDKSHDSETEIK